MNKFERTIKRMTDVAVSVSALVTLAPFLAAIAGAVAVDSEGPVIFRQARVGRAGRVFRILKFRTMRQDAELLVDLEIGRVVNRENDQRHTRVGRILRRFSLDELPQLINVLLGDMSFVGPRPDLPMALEYDTPELRRRLDVRPGITGLAQVTGRNSLSLDEKWRLDTEYALDATLVTDVCIVFRTVRRVLRRNGLYTDDAPTWKH